jgi:ABC-type molybdate transport system substrate-binding protein
VTIKGDIIAAIKACAEASGNDDLRVGLGDPTAAPNGILLRGVTTLIGKAYAIPGFLDCLLTGIATGISGGYQSASVSARTSTTLSSFQTKLQLVTPALTGTYRVGWSALVDNIGPLGEAQLYNVTDASVVGGVRIYSLSAGQRRDVGSPEEIVFTGASKTLEIQFRDVAGGNTQGIRNARIELWKVG